MPPGAAELRLNQVLRLDVPLGFLRGERHWISLRSGDEFHVLRVDSEDVSRVLAALEQRSGHTAEHVTDK